MKSVVAKALARYFICLVKISLWRNIACEIACFEEFIDPNGQEIPLVHVIASSPSTPSVFMCEMYIEEGDSTVQEVRVLDSLSHGQLGCWSQRMYSAGSSPHLQGCKAVFAQPDRQTPHQPHNEVGQLE